MPQLVPEALGFLHYNGFTFPSTTTVEPVRRTIVAEDGVTYKCSEYEITATCVVTCEDTYEAIAPESTTDTLMTYLRRVFSTIGAKFCFANFGYGTICLNNAVTVPQFIYPATPAVSRVPSSYTVTHTPIEVGPVVDMDEPEFFGFNRSLLLKVRFTFRIYDQGDCAVWASDNRRMTEMQLSRSWTTSRNGYVTRVTKGHVSYWTVFNVGGTLINQEFNFIVQNVVPPIPAYQREQSYDPDPDNRGFSFTITDTPTESPLPFVSPIQHMDMTHTVSGGLSRDRGFFNLWNVSFDFDVEVMQDRAKSDCMPYISQVILERMTNIIGAAGDGSELFVPIYNNKHLLMGLTITDNVTSNRFKMKTDWRCRFELHNVLTASKILSRPTAFAQNNWAAWSISMFGIQGYSAPNFQLQTLDTTVNACSNNQIPKKIYDIFNTPQLNPPVDGPYTHPPAPSSQNAPYSNYMGFYSKHRIESDSQSYGAPRGNTSAGPGYVARNGVDASGGNAPPSSGSALTPSSSIYRIGPTRSTYVCYGGAQRAGALPAIPALVTYDGVAIPEIGQSAIEITQFVTPGNVPIFEANWYLSYQLPNEIPPGVNPFTKLALTLTEPLIHA